MKHHEYEDGREKIYGEPSSFEAADVGEGAKARTPVELNKQGSTSTIRMKVLLHFIITIILFDSEDSSIVASLHLYI